MVRAQRVWCTVSESSDDRVDGGNEEAHRSALQTKHRGSNNVIINYVIAIKIIVAFYVKNVVAKITNNNLLD